MTCKAIHFWCKSEALSQKYVHHDKKCYNPTNCNQLAFGNILKKDRCNSAVNSDKTNRTIEHLILATVAELCQVQYLVPEVQGTFCTLYRLVDTRYSQVPCTCSPVQGTFEYLVPTSRYKVLLRTLYLPPGTRFCTGSGTNRYMVKYTFFYFFFLIMAMLRI